MNKTFYSVPSHCRYWPLLRIRSTWRQRSRRKAPTQRPGCLLGQFGDWGAYRATPGGKKVCFALSKPTSAVTEPAGRNRDPVLRLHLHAAVGEGEERSVGDRRLSAEARRTTPRPPSARRNYSMYTQNDGAWVKNAAEEAQMVDAMRKGAELVVKGESARGTKTTDTYSLKGIAQALDKVAAGVQVARRDRRALVLARAGSACSWPSNGIYSGMTRYTANRIAPFVEKAPLERYVAPEKPSLVGLTRAQLADALGEVGVPEAQRKMRVQQLWHWIYFRGFTSFDEMTSVSKELRAALAGRFTLARPEVVAEQVSVDGTRKWLLRLPGEVQGERPHEVECVYIPDTERGTLCVSSQVGCTLTCTFCHTGTQRLVRNLTAGEIVGQVLAARDRLGDWQRKSGSPDLRGLDPNSGKPEFGGTRPTDGVIPSGDRCITNIVMMGMGEPLYNFEAVRDALLIVADGEGIGISKRRITLSTSGVVPNISTSRRRDWLHAGGIAACGARRASQRAGAAQSKISDC